MRNTTLPSFSALLVIAEKEGGALCAIAQDMLCKSTATKKMGPKKREAEVIIAIVLLKSAFITLAHGRIRFRYVAPRRPLGALNGKQGRRRSLHSQPSAKISPRSTTDN
ncbi:MAG: hypothetical protein U1E97_06070 [Alphaproteobacteria bacterium]